MNPFQGNQCGVLALINNTFEYEIGRIIKYPTVFTYNIRIENVSEVLNSPLWKIFIKLLVSECKVFYEYNK